MTSTEKYKILSNELNNYANKLKDRDNLWIEIGKELKGDNYPEAKVQSNIEEKVNNEVLKRKNAWDIINDVYTDHIKILKNLNVDTTCNLNNSNVSNLNDKNQTMERKYGFKSYNILLNKENIKILLTFVLANIISLVGLLLTYFDFINLSYSIIIIIVFYLIFIFYTIKIMVLDRANRNNVYFYKYDFNKPSSGESKSDTNSNSNKKECDSDYGRAAVSLKTIENNKMLTEIKASTQLDSEKCLSN
jgi:hypothetical protein|uniref:Uncharacterized protein n=1 Tax=Mimiviridae sp. ChoanoV1 TaxID=2596887 RepID=A0A5B8HW04_9VIRU|nr:hypothetical protein 1_228 [Mimiviridae sp. ChoanoV1]